MNNLLSYCGLVDPRISASDKDLPVHKNSCGKYVYVEQENQNKENHRLQTTYKRKPSEDTNFDSINVTNTIKGKSLKIQNTTYVHIKLLNLVKRRNSIMRKLLHN